MVLGIRATMPPQLLPSRRAVLMYPCMDTMLPICRTKKPLVSVPEPLPAICSQPVSASTGW